MASLDRVAVVTAVADPEDPAAAEVAAVDPAGVVPASVETSWAACSVVS